MTDRVSVIGAGSWGTTIAWLLADNGCGVTLWAREEEVCASIENKRENDVFLPGVKLPENLRCTTSLKEAVSGAGVVVSVVPSHALRAVFTGAAPDLGPDAVVVSASKGIEEGTHLTPSGILADTLKETPHGALSVLSGPTFAKEVSMRLPAAACAASVSAEAAELTQRLFSAPYFRVYTNADVVGVELGGALKNVVAIASGISDGLKLGFNARAALITRGLAEITRLGVSMGADPATFSGLSGMGDLVLTCTGPLSRNYSVGLAIGEGRTLEEVTASMKMVAEGVKTARAAKSLADERGVEMPITSAVVDVLYGGVSASEAVFELMTRELREE